jgi:hypothetical protein
MTGWLNRNFIIESEAFSTIQPNSTMLETSAKRGEEEEVWGNMYFLSSNIQDEIRRRFADGARRRSQNDSRKNNFLNKHKRKAKEKRKIEENEKTKFEGKAPKQ